jgi:hypothetical protein
MTARTRFFPHEFRGPSVPGSQQRGPKRQQLGYFSSLLSQGVSGAGQPGLSGRDSGWQRRLSKLLVDNQLMRLGKREHCGLNHAVSCGLLSIQPRKGVGYG